ncbi:restriction endonuclease subunit S [Aeromonas hydrophila]|uniref:restriction endonuclease subunit S n=1 Tax=Aeromonas hydrophila TaxID=644 RepID=UPI003F78CDFA
MGSNWPITSLDSHISIKHGFAFKGEFFKDSPTPDCLLTPGNFAIGGGFKGDKYKYYDGPVPSDYVLKAGDLVVTMTDLSKQADTLGYSALIPEQQNKCFLHNQRTGLVQFKDDELDKVFLYFLLRSKEYRHHVVSGATGTTVKHTSPTKILSYKFRKPPKPLQVAIGLNLLSIEKKININHQINQTLEQMAQALFKSWFVDFDPVIDNALDAGFFEQDLAFPDELLRRAEARRAVRERGEFKPLPDATRQLFPAAFEDGAEPSVGLGGWVPKGWQVQSIKDFANVTDFVANGSFAALKENVTLFDNPEYALYIRTTDFKNDFDKEKAKYIDKHAYEFLSKTKLSGAEVIISNVGDVGTVFRPPSWLGMPMTLGSNAIAISTQSLNDYLYFYFSSQAGQSAIDGIVSGSAQQKFNKTGFRSLRLLLPSNNVVIKFNEVYQDISSKIISNKKNVRHLELLRDTLLPKLISGELHLDNIDAELAKVDVA